MQVIQDFTEEITCHYDNGKEPASFIECLEQEQGWDADFKPCQAERTLL